ncbi:unnamed protein product [Gongylonema pulchrum]|uniref:IncA protein n=1 Tax=Gongylonema pulchrum TaxID=637853 RepID=A0A183DJF4_9BILA|nr:unnamed protein product [Gongylonema pulchrum]
MEIRRSGVSDSGPSSASSVSTYQLLVLTVIVLLLITAAIVAGTIALTVIIITVLFTVIIAIAGITCIIASVALTGQKTAIFDHLLEAVRRIQVQLKRLYPYLLRVVSVSM